MASFKEFLLLRIPVGEREREWNFKKTAGGLAFSFRLYSKKKNLVVGCSQSNSI